MITLKYKEFLLLADTETLSATDKSGRTCPLAVHIALLPEEVACAFLGQLEGTPINVDAVATAAGYRRGWARYEKRNK